MDIIMVRSLKGFPDSRVEKELYSLSKEHNVFLFGWNRYSNEKKITKQVVDVFDKQIDYYHYNHKAPIGLGFKKLFLPLLKFWINEYIFLKKHVSDFDVVHACDFDTVLPALLVAKKYKKKIVYDIFDYYSDSHLAPKSIKKIIKKIDNFIIGKCDATIICSEKRREQISGSNPKNLEIIHNTPMQIDSINKYGLVKEKNICNLVYIGVLSDDRYLREIAEIVKKRSDVVWHIGGWGVLSEYFSELANKYESIKFYGEVSYLYALELESKCDIMTALYDPCVPNHKYAAPNKFYESLMLGKPLIMIKNTGMDKYISDNNLGEVIDLKNIDFKNGFEFAISNLIEKKAEWKDIKNKAQKIYEDEFSWKKMEERLLNLYRILSSCTD